MLFLLGVKELGSKGVKTLVFLFIPLPSERSGGGWLIPTKKALVRQRRSALNIMSILKRCHKKNSEAVFNAFPTPETCCCIHSKQGFNICYLNISFHLKHNRHRLTAQASSLK